MNAASGRGAIVLLLSVASDNLSLPHIITDLAGYPVSISLYPGYPYHHP